MTVLRRSLATVLFFLVAYIPLSLAQGTYTQIDVPGAVTTEAAGINTAGEIVGTYIDSAGGHGFLFSGGTYTTVDYPGTQYSYAQGINDAGQIVGLAEPTGYLYDIASQTFTAISYPGADFTYAMSINNSGTIAGYALVADSRGTFEYQGFELVGSSYTPIAPPGSVGTFVNGVSGSGDVVGYADVNGSYVNFRWGNGKYRKITNLNSAFPLVYGVNPAGTAIVGSYEPFAGITGFLYQNKTFQALSFPGSITTVAFGINSKGEVVGYYLDGSFVTHGFLWTPPAHSPE